MAAAVTPGQAKQRLVAIDVGEVSMVDHPANDQPFVVTKAVAQGGTPVTTTQVTKADVGLPPEVAAKLTLSYLQDCMWELQRKLADPSKYDETKAELQRIGAMIDKVQEFQAQITKSVTEMTTACAKAKGDDKGKMPAFMKEAMAKVVDTLKGMIDEEEGDEYKATKAIDAIIELAKAGKAQFSKDRLAKLKEAFGHLGTMYKEADADGFHATVSGWAPAPAAAATTTTATTTAPATKSADAQPEWLADLTKSLDALKTAVTGVATAQTDITKRVETVEKAAAGTKTLTEGAGNDGTTKPVEKSIWGNVLRLNER